MKVEQKSILLIIGIMLIAANLRAPLTSVGPLVGSIKESLGITNTMTGVLTTLPLIAFAILSPFASKLSRRFGLENILFISLLFIAVGISLRFFHAIETLFLGTLLIGLGIAVGNVLIPSLIKSKFSHNLGVMTGIYAVSMNICAAIASGVSVPIAMKIGWHGSLGYWTLIAVIAIIFWIPQMKSKLEAQKQPARKQTTNMWKSPLAWKVTLFMGLQSLMFYTFIAWLPEILGQYGVSKNAAGWMLSYMQMAVIPFTFIIPVLATRMKNQRPLVAVISLLFLLGTLGILFGNLYVVYLSVIVFGIAAGSSFSLSMILFNLRTKNAEQAADLSGMAQSVGYLLAAIGPAMFGLLHDFYHSWDMSLWMLVIVIVLIFIYGLAAGKNQTV